MIKPPDAISFDLSDIPTLLKALREEQGLTQKMCAEKMGSQNESQYEQYEAGRRTPSVEQLEKLLNIFDLKLGMVALKGIHMGELMMAATKQAPKIRAKTILRKAV